MNVVPLVDVVLVLLIIFMLTASAMEFGLEVDVPEVKSSRTTVEELPVITLDRNFQAFLNDRPVANLALMGQEVRERFPGEDDVYVRADRQLTWENVAQVFSALGDAGLNVKAVTKTEDIRGKR
jgi:biopolymer transport protein ExbD